MKVVNKQGGRNFEIIERYEAGVALLGAEVKSVKAGNIILEGAHVRIVGDELYLMNAQIPIYRHSRPEDYDPRRSRKLLLHKSEIIRLKTKLKSASKLTIIPTSCYNKKYLVKVEIAIARGRREIEKKKIEHKEAIKRQQEREAKEYMR